MAFEGLIEDLKDRWTEIPKWQKWIGYLFLLIAIIFVYKMQVLDPIEMRIKQLSMQVEQKRTRVAKLKIVEKRRDALNKEIAQLKDAIAKLESELPTGKEAVSNIIKAIAESVKSTKVEMIKRGKEKENEYYKTIDYSVILSSRYPNFISWCENIVKAKRVMTFGTISMVALDPKKKEIEIETDGKKEKRSIFIYPYTLQINLKLNAYTLKR